MEKIVSKCCGRKINCLQHRKMKKDVCVFQKMILPSKKIMLSVCPGKKAKHKYGVNMDQQSRPTLKSFFASALRVSITSHINYCLSLHYVTF